MDDSCIGCGYCCTKASCAFVFQEMMVNWHEWDGCPFLEWDGERHWCQLMQGRLDLQQEMSGGCGSNLNSWRHAPLRDRRKS